ncbi:hypothetical protein EJP82_26725 [Paenibacillus anaericanus]|uniref:Uncharacterized protein n=1 Tax=Paenibacillus anaericanus TaxID=170367 RepID=A0A433XVI8_9BACL|nr:hypothetical protein [Paenibacillus anaericanus]RUT38710.1 hypothetical protein EJP82_26725 [Paenibacillus anaericanus]
MPRTRNSIWVDVPPQPRKTQLQKRVERVITKADKKGYEFNDIELSMFNALGNAEWIEKDISWLVIEQFDRMYYKFFPSK